MKTPQYEPHDDPERLKRLYWGAGMSQAEIGRSLGVSSSAISRAMERYGIETRNNGGGRSTKHAKLIHSKGNPYPNWSSGENDVYVHQLLAIAKGNEPAEVFSDGENHVHHKNEIPWDNRPENIELLPAGEHMSIHNDGSNKGNTERKYTDEEMLEWIDLFVSEFGVVPASGDIQGWPGPSNLTYQRWFGSFTNAVREAGYTPRGDSDE